MNTHPLSPLGIRLRFLIVWLGVLLAMYENHRQDAEIERLRSDIARQAAEVAR